MEQRCQQQRCVHVSRLVDMRLIFCCNHAKRPTSELTSRRHMNRRSSVSASPSSSSGSTLGTRIRRRIPLTFRRCIYRPFKVTVCRRSATLWRTSSSWWTLRSTLTANISNKTLKTSSVNAKHLQLFPIVVDWDSWPFQVSPQGCKERQNSIYRISLRDWRDVALAAVFFVPWPSCAIVTFPISCLGEVPGTRWNMSSIRWSGRSAKDAN